MKINNDAIKMPSLRDLCQKNISNYDFERLHEVAKVSKHAVTKAFKNPREMKYSLLLALCDLLKVNAITLIDQYGCGLSGMTAEEYRSLLPTQTNESNH